MFSRQSIVCGIVAAIVGLNSSPGFAQELPLAPIASRGEATWPFFEGYWSNPDGTYTLSFGYFNRNMSEEVIIPVGPNNYIEPAEYNGVQPTHFPPRRQIGVFTVTVPASFTTNDRVVWTLVNAGGTHSVPGKIGSAGYELGFVPMAMGSLPPTLRLRDDGPDLHGPMTVPAGSGPGRSSSGGIGSVGDPLVMDASTTVPLRLTVWAKDRFDGEERDTVPVQIAWFTHNGPVAAVFSETELVAEASPTGGYATTEVTFTEPGEYVLRVRAGTFDAIDSSPGAQCCWTNGFVKVRVAS